MRADVKLGMVCSAVIVLLAGGYYLWRSPGDVPIRFSDSTSTTKPDTPTPGVAKQPTQDTTTRNIAAPNAGRRAQKTDRRSPNRAATARATAGKRGPAQATSHKSQNQRTQVAGRTSGAADAARRSPPTRADASRSLGADGKRSIGSGGLAANDLSSRAPNTATSNPNGTTSRKGFAEGASNAGRSNGAPNRSAANRQPASHPGARTARTLTATTPKASRPTTKNVAVERHVVQPGDSFAALARRYYGSERFTGYLLKSNPQVSDPKRLKVGASLRIPPRPDEPATVGAPSSSGGSSHGAQGVGRTYRVREGDSFYAIARDRLGDASRWRELFELNKARVNGDPTTLRVGQEIALPAK